MIIDIHTHAWPDKISQKAREHLESSFRVKLVGEPTLGTLVKFMDKNGINVSVICAVASKPEQVHSINDWLFQIRSKRIKVFCALHPDYNLWEDELDRIKKRGDGIKLQPEFQDFYIDEPKALPLYDKIQALGLPLLFHCGKELSGTKLIRSSPNRLLNLRNLFPSLKIIAGHFGGFQLWDEVEKYILGKDIYLDTSFFFDYLAPEKIKSLLLAHPSNRLLFGTDFPLVDQKKDLDFLNKLDLPQSLKEKIFFSNAQEVLGLS